MSEVRLLDIGEIEEELFTRWDSQVLHFFAGVGSIDDIGYEAYAGQAEAIPSLGGRQGSSPCG
jgi:hypothetical protein